MQEDKQCEASEKQEMEKVTQRLNHIEARNSLLLLSGRDWVESEITNPWSKPYKKVCATEKPKPKIKELERIAYANSEKVERMSQLEERPLVEINVTFYQEWLGYVISHVKLLTVITQSS